MKNYFIKYLNPLYMGGGIRKFHDAGASGGAGGGSGAPAAETPEAKLLTEIQAKVKTELETRKYKNQSEVEGMIKTALEGMPLDALRAYSDDKIKLDTTIKNLAAAVEKLKNMPVLEGQGQQTRQFLKEVFNHEEVLKQIRNAMSRQGAGQQVVLNTRAAIVMTVANVLPDEAIPEDILHSFSLEAFIPKRYPKEYIWDFIGRRTVAEVTEYKAWLEEGSEEGAFAIVSEGGLKPLVSKTLVRNTTKVRKIAGKHVYTEEFAKFRKVAYNILQDLFRDQLMRNYAAILVTDLLAAASSYTGTVLDDQYADPTDYHAIGAVAAQIESLEFFPDLLIMNPQDKWRIGLSQDSQGRFFTAVPMYNPSGEVTIMGFRVLTSTRVTAGTFILGESGMYRVEDEPITIRMGYGVTVTGANPVTAVEADFDHNRFRIIMELYFHNWIGTNNTGSFVTGNFADIKAALEAPAI